MIKVEHSVVINRSVEEVFAFITDLKNDLHWQSGMMESSKTPDRQTGVGTVVRHVRRFLGRQIDASVEITEYEPNKKIWLRSISGPFRFTGGYTFEPLGHGSRVAVAFEGETTGLYRLVQTMIAGELKRQIEADYQKLKELLET